MKTTWKGMEVLSEVPISLSLSLSDSGFVDLLWNATERKQNDRNRERERERKKKRELVRESEREG